MFAGSRRFVKRKASPVQLKMEGSAHDAKLVLLSREEGEGPEGHARGTNERSELSKLVPVVKCSGVDPPRPNSSQRRGKPHRGRSTPGALLRFSSGRFGFALGSAPFRMATGGGGELTGAPFAQDDSWGRGGQARTGGSWSETVRLWGRSSSTSPCVTLSDVPQGQSRRVSPTRLCLDRRSSTLVSNFGAGVLPPEQDGDRHRFSCAGSTYVPYVLARLIRQ